MISLRFTLLGEGSSDSALLEVLAWLLRHCGVTRVLQPQWADLYHLPRKPVGDVERIAAAFTAYECDLLFVHRDADRSGYSSRRGELVEAITDHAAAHGGHVPIVCVVPVRMTESWLLLDEAAIRSAAGNPNGSVALDMPDPMTVESIPDPKKVLRDLVLRATELSGRRLKHFRVSNRLVAERTADFVSLLHLPAFSRLREEVTEVVQRSRWDR